MKCPIDGETLVIADRSGVEIDYCPKCRGVWLDRGELDKIIERAEPPRAAPPPHQGGWDRDERHHHGDRRDGHRRPERRESFLSELFDFEL
ncbi:zf-TFIIB domain-containing protein [Hyphobacterium sp.]|uniref:TFIIB-type zinc ribbon-containing protein n=1 Tax=Hyphobacterium sp. TaxID=2004662 RepID=UPI003BA91EDF